MMRAYAVQYKHLGKWNTQETYACPECAHHHARVCADDLTPDYRVLTRYEEERFVWGDCPGHASKAGGA